MYGMVWHGIAIAICHGYSSKMPGKTSLDHETLWFQTSFSPWNCAIFGGQSDKASTGLAVDDSQLPLVN
jgi:hypothetical protein